MPQRWGRSVRWALSQQRSSSPSWVCWHWPSSRGKCTRSARSCAPAGLSETQRRAIPRLGPSSRFSTHELLPSRHGSPPKSARRAIGRRPDVFQTSSATPKLSIGRFGRRPTLAFTCNTPAGRYSWAMGQGEVILVGHQLQAFLVDSPEL